MLRGEVESVDTDDPAAFRDAYRDLLVSTIERIGPATVTDRSGVDESVIEAIRSGESPTVSLTDAAAILAADEERPDADSIAAEAREILLMGMSSAVLDVEALASGIDDAMEPKEIQGKVEGRHSMTLDEYATLQAYIEGRKR